MIYPRELHHIQKELHKLDVLERMTRWFDRFLNCRHKRHTIDKRQPVYGELIFARYDAGLHTV